MVTVLRTGSDKFGQVWTIQNRCEALFFLNRESHAVQIWPTPKLACSFLTVPRSKLYDLPKRNSALSRFNWRKVWTGVKCNFSWDHFQKRYIIRKLSFSRVRMWNFTRIGGHETKKVMAFDNSCTKAVLSASPGPTPKRCEPQLFLAAHEQVVYC